jgi:type I restriction enzyme R subunit
MSLHKEVHFETDICAALIAGGWLHADGDAEHFDRASGLFLPDLVAWFEAAQPDAWATVTKNHGADAVRRVAERLRKSLDERGTLDVLRRGVEIVGLKAPLALMGMKPALWTPETEARYAANRLRVVRQVRHSPNHLQDALDLVLFLNGVPVATAELKSDFTQSVGDAVDQYRFDRHPQPKGGVAEPLLGFPGGALVHFAVSQSEVMMTTRLAGTDTRFLPFNRGNAGGAGNAPVAGGNATSYLWEDVWARDSWLQILQRYLIARRDDKGRVSSVIFPRYHQLDATRRLVAEIQAQGAGGRYLIQHSAGSGKTNSIAWLAHFLADLHGADNQKLFNSVLVVSDRNVLDAQLQEAIFDFERAAGVVASISGDQGSKSAQLTQALKDGKKIIVCTIQTFPYALEQVQKMAATEGKRFAVIADEAHSSQTGQAASKLRQLLSAAELAELEDGGEIDTETLLAAGMEARANTQALTYVAFTATPKAKTLELFGQPGPDGLPQPFHVYSMRQAIEEGFILDVLRNYTPYDLAFRLAHDGREVDQREVERSAAMKGIMQWVRLHPWNIASKVQIVVEHYRETVQPLLEGRAKAMIVVASRKEAVRWQRAVRAYIESKGYNLGVLTAFSGEVNDPESYPEPVSETSKLVNPGLKGRDIREAFAQPAFHLLLVANKFQTGFDQPLLCGMYVDKQLAGIQAVQTLSRLNRAHPGKDTTYIIDFVNDPAEVLKAFKTYYETAELEARTDPNIVFDLRAKLDAAGHYDAYEVDRVARIETDPKAKQYDLSAALAPVADRLLRRYKAAQAEKAAAEAAGQDAAAHRAKDTLDALLLFKADMGAFCRLYAFLSQIFDYGNTDIEKRFMFYKRLIPLLDFGRERDQVDLSKVVLTHHTLRRGARVALNLAEGEAEPLPPIDASGSGAVQEKDRVLLAEIIERVNGLFEGQLTEDDQLVYVNGVLKGKLLENQTLIDQAASNEKVHFSNSPDLANALTQAIMDALDAHTTMSQQALASKRIQEGLKDILLGPGQLYEALRERGRGAPTPQQEA